MTQISRRSLFGAAAAASVLPVAGGLAAFSPIAAAAAAPKKARTIVEIAAMSPIDMARKSDVVQTSYEIIRAAAGRLRDPELRKAVLSIIENPAPTIASADQSAVLAALKKEGLIAAGRTSVFPKFSDTTRSPQPTWSAPGSGYGSHHAYPGGLCTHVALNVVSAESLVAAYDNIDGLKLDFDHAVGGEILHDLHKPWVFQWEADNACRKEEALAGTGEHHVLSIAESIKRGLPAEFVVAQACAHEHPGSASGEAQVVGWLRAAAIIAGVDKLFDMGRTTLNITGDATCALFISRLERGVVHLADHDWVISVPACQWVVKALRNLAEKKWGVRDEKTFNALRNYVLCNLTAMRLYGILSAQGEEAFAADVARVVKA